MHLHSTAQDIHIDTDPSGRCHHFYNLAHKTLQNQFYISVIIYYSLHYHTVIINVLYIIYLMLLLSVVSNEIMIHSTIHAHF